MRSSHYTVVIGKREENQAVGKLDTKQENNRFVESDLK
jgi:hypothetical protein